MASYGNDGFGAVPASSEVVARLLETTAHETGDQKEYGVCLDEFAEGDRLRAMPCSHGFYERHRQMARDQPAMLLRIPRS
ncbi:unnamed protein product [Urochloa humidicola]